MPNLNSDRLTDITIGIGSWPRHGFSCCPHVLIGFRITGSPNTDVNCLDASQITSLSWHYPSCPHCFFNMCITGTPSIYINNLLKAGQTHIVTEFCGIGCNVTGSPNTYI